MQDSFGRNIEYMRVSVTDRCNLRCKYCMPGDLPFIPHGEILRYEEILRVLGIMARLGVRSIRVTGGEPLARKGCVDFIRRLKATPEVERVMLTTNGVLLGEYIHELAGIGLDGINISLDTLDRESYARLTGKDEFKNVIRAIEASVDAGFRVKINCVLLRDVNGGELAAFAGLAERLPVEVRFIELMPTGAGEAFGQITAPQALDELKAKYPDLSPDLTQRGSGPARYFKSAGLKGAIGFIEAISNHFCGSCNRLRLTSGGFLKLCLYHGDGLDLRGLLRSGAADEEIAQSVEEAVMRKPERHLFGEGGNARGIEKMSSIGG